MLTTLAVYQYLLHEFSSFFFLLIVFFNGHELFVCSLLTRPSDGKADNFMVTPKEDLSGLFVPASANNTEASPSEGNYFIIGIDNGTHYPSPWP